ncbi:MAG TPA: dihydropteroate synthase [Kiritimatiellia bacterium]|nr:dihydropteroate synthase [Kiritimatiellia bacterium]HMP32883.1 dihydropteroate synthase [Kiritimatiellia bacterium]
MTQAGTWQAMGRNVLVPGRTAIMGILNVTPDSFSDGGRFVDPDQAVVRALAMVEEGADIIDVGGESTRPGADPVSIEEEIRRVVPVIARLSHQSDVLISVDTRRAPVACNALAAGAHIVNDVSGLGHDREMAAAIRAFDAGLVLMHMQGQPRTMQDQPRYEDVVGEVGSFLAGQVARAIASGIPAERIAVDPGIGFGKTLDHNLELLRALPQLAAATGRPLLLGVSRKRWIGQITGREVDDRLAGSLAALAWCIQQGARIIRVHDVKESCDAARLVDRLKSTEGMECR